MSTPWIIGGIVVSTACQVGVNSLQKLPLTARPWRYGLSLLCGCFLGERRHLGCSLRHTVDRCWHAGNFAYKFDKNQREEHAVMVEKYKQRQLDYQAKSTAGSNSASAGAAVTHADK
jgi:hypothetical protein